MFWVLRNEKNHFLLRTLILGPVDERHLTFRCVPESISNKFYQMDNKNVYVCTSDSWADPMGESSKFSKP